MAIPFDILVGAVTGAWRTMPVVHPPVPNHRDMAAVLRVLDDFLATFVETGQLSSGRANLDANNDAIVLTVNYARLGAAPQQFHYQMSEFRMGGSTSWGCWLTTVEDSILTHTGAGFRRSSLRHDSAHAMAAALNRVVDDNLIASFINILGANATDNPEANQRAADLFKLVAGKKAFDLLEASQPLPITGSNGTAYTLHKRATYCVERVSDNARLCAVVPGVPLWDHLLGIKLMVEHDEALFLRTANISSAMTATAVRDLEYQRRSLFATTSAEIDQQRAEQEMRHQQALYEINRRLTYR